MVALMVILVSLATAVPAPAQTGGAMAERVGLGTHLIWLGQSDAEAEMRRIRTGGVHWIREDFRWDLVEPQKGTFDWRRTDTVMAAAATTGMDVLAILDYSARWASSDPTGAGDVHYPPRDPADYARYARAVVERYGAGGSFWTARPDLVPRPLEAVELWNEPWGYWFWKPDPDPVAYARLAHAAASEVKAAQPLVKVLLAGDVLLHRRDRTARPWLDAVLDADPSLHALIDAYSTHPYPHPKARSPLDKTSIPESRFDRNRITAQVAAARGASKPIWITEVGWSTASGSPDAVSEETQAEYVGLAVSHAVGVQDVERIFVFSWDRSSGAYGDVEGNYGLRRSNGTTKPAWDALRDLVANGPLALPLEHGPVSPARVAPPPPRRAAPSGTSAAPRACKRWRAIRAAQRRRRGQRRRGGRAWRTARRARLRCRAVRRAQREARRSAA